MLARLLMPKDFGIVAMATMVSGLAGIFSDLAGPDGDYRLKRIR